MFYENSPDNSFADFDYENNVLVGYRYSNSLNDVFISTLKEPNNYIVAAYPDTNPDIFYSQIELERVDGLVTSFQHTVLNTQKVFSKYQFEYQNGNLTSIISELNEDVYTIEYDDKKTYGVEAGFITKDNHCLGFYLAMQNDIGYFPAIVDYTNSNNITRIYKNGEVIVSYEYEYNEFDLPVKIFVNGNSAPRMLTYTYVPKT